MNPYRIALIISGKTKCSSIVEEICAEYLSPDKIYRVKTTKEGLQFLNKIEIRNNRLPALVFLNVEQQDDDSFEFLEMMERDYASVARNSIILLNKNLPIKEVIKLATNDCVFHFANCPVVEPEVRSMFELKMEMARV